METALFDQVEDELKKFAASSQFETIFKGGGKFYLHGKRSDA